MASALKNYLTQIALNFYLVLFLLVSITVEAQKIEKIDSLIALLEYENTPEEIISIYQELIHQSGTEDSLSLVKYFTNALELIENLDNSEKQVEHFLILIEGAKKIKAYTLAAQAANKLLKHPNTTNTPTLEALAYKKKAQIFAGLNQYDSAIKLRKLEANVYEVINEKDSLFKCYNAIALNFFNQKIYDSALAYYTDALAFKSYEKLREEDNLKSYDSLEVLELGETLFNIGLNNSYTGNYEESIQFYEQSLKISLLYNDSARSVTNYKNIGLSHQLLGYYSEALENYFKAIEIAPEESINDIISIELNIGIIHKNLENTETAIEYFTKALQKSKEVNSAINTLSAYNNLGTLYTQLEKYEMGLKYYDSCLLVSETIGFQRGIQASYNNIGEGFYYLGNYDSAKIYYTNAMEFPEVQGNSDGLAYSLLGLGRIYSKTGNLERSGKYLERGLKYFENYENKELEGAYLEELSMLYAAKNEYKEAYEYHTKYKQVNDSLRSENLTNRITRLQAESDFKNDKDSIENANKIIQLSLKQKIENQRKVQLSLVVGICIFMILMIILVKYHKLKETKNEELSRVNLMLKEKNDNITKKNKALDTTLKKLKSVQIQLIEKEKLATLGTFAKGVSHEINNPLNFIKTSSNLLSEMIYNPTENQTLHMHQYLQIIDNAVERISKIIKTLGRYSSKDIDTTSRCDLHEILNNSIVLAKKQNKKSVDIIQNYSDVSVVLIGNEGELHQLFFNIILNSIQASEEGSKICVSTECEDEVVKVEISDNGKGIKKSDQDKVFEPFFTTKSPNEGAGLGLYIVGEIIKMHNASYKIISKEKVGTRLSIEFPNYIIIEKSIERSLMEN